MAGTPMADSSNQVLHSSVRPQQRKSLATNGTAPHDDGSPTKMRNEDRGEGRIKTRSVTAMEQAQAAAASAQNGSSSSANHLEYNNGKDTADKSRSKQPKQGSHWLSYLAVVVLAYLSYATYPPSLAVTQGITIQHVWYYGWITALSTGLGTLPFLIVSDMNQWWLGISNATAAGMMLAASMSLFYEGLVLESDHPCSIPQAVRVTLGLVGGLVFITSTKQILDRYEDIKVAGLDVLEARKVLLLIFVMTLHSFTEGVGIGVSFGGKNGPQLGVFISATLAVHNVPEGLAVALVLVPKRISKLNTALWSIFTSIPQPLMAVPAYLFVEQFIPFLPVGLGFAAGAMLWVAIFELLVDALEDTGSKVTTGMVTVMALLLMLGLQQIIKDET